ncbi:MAG: dephospho-CoA kinase [Anaerolineae bacterium]|nr:dephospho-CoA kinase [Anaerolineae bacterium]
MPRAVIGLTGNIATGKSTVAELLRARGAFVINADQLARAAVAPGTPALAQIVAQFGSGVLLPDGALDRRALGQLVFSDPAKLRQLEAIVHPVVRASIAQHMAEAPPDGIVVLEVIRLFEGGLDELCDEVWVTHCPPEIQLQRLTQLRGLTEQEAAQRIAAQTPQADKLARANVVIDTSGSLTETERQVQAAWQRLTCRLQSKL